MFNSTSGNNTMLNTMDPASTSGSPFTGQARDSLKSTIEYELWVSAQATSLSKLKLFHTMAKSVNDQQ